MCICTASRQLLFSDGFQLRISVVLGLIDILSLAIFDAGYYCFTRVRIDRSL